MPTYLYKCLDCEIEIEEKRPMSQANDPLPCPLCGEMCVRGITSFRVVSRGRTAPPSTGDNAAAPSPLTHAANCFCCTPKQRRSNQLAVGSNEGSK